MITRSPSLRFTVISCCDFVACINVSIDCQNNWAFAFFLHCLILASPYDEITFVKTFQMKIKPYHLLFGSFFCLTAVILGAFGAHALKEVLKPEQLLSFETGVRYQMFHGLILVMIALKGHSFHLRYEKWIVSLFGVGIILFSFSIYLLNIQDLLRLDFRLLGPITPIGGLLIITA